MVGAVLIDWDIVARRSWVHGPWIAVGDARWTPIGAALVGAAMSQLPDGLRPMTVRDVAAVASLHDVEFPDTYGDGYIDFLAVALSARGAGRGRTLVGFELTVSVG